MATSPIQAETVSICWCSGKPRSLRPACPSLVPWRCSAVLCLALASFAVTQECSVIALAATTIATIYKDRWEIELFFKACKQNLKVKTFVSTSEIALRIEIWTAVVS